MYSANTEPIKNLLLLGDMKQVISLAKPKIGQISLDIALK